MRTPEQQKYYDMMAGRRARVRRQNKKAQKQFIIQEISVVEYMRNCFFWVEEYIEGRTDRNSFHSALKALHEHISKLEQKYF